MRLDNLSNSQRNHSGRTQFSGISKTTCIVLLVSVLLFSHAQADGTRYDESTFSNMNEVETVNFNLTLSFDFDKRVINGTQTISVKAIKDNVCKVVLDIWNMNITSVMMFGYTKLEYTIEDPNPALGKALNITGEFISEPSMIEKAANELSELEENLKRAEAYLTPYEWGVYKILILPPSFPFGGMENPLLTFASPTIIVGDKSSVDVATHEIAHSWTGNLVTNMNWENFWLNEGFTVFTERKVTRMKEGDAFYNVASKLGNYSMVSDMQNYGWDHSYSSLTPKMHGANPDDSFSSIPYEKGFQFITYLESLIGENLFQKYYRQYVNKFKFQSITVDDMKNSYINFVKEHFDEKKANNILKQIDWETWIYTPGLPPVTLNFESQEYNDAVSLAHEYIDGKGEVSPSDKDKYKEWFVSLKGIFLSELLNADDVTEKIVSLVDNDLRVSQEINTEILYLWYQLTIINGKNVAPYTDETQFLKSVGRLKYIQPIFLALFSVNKEFALSTYHSICDQYHPIAQSFLEQAMKTTKCSPSLVKKLLKY